MSTYITVTNSLCQIKKHPKFIDDLLFKELAFKDKDVEYSVLKYAREINRLRRLLNSKAVKLSRDKTVELEKKLRQNQYICSDLEEKLWVPLFDDEGYFPTGLLEKVKALLKENSVEFKIKDQREKPKLNKHRFVLKESFPSLRWYQKKAIKELRAKERGVVELATGTGKTLTACRIIWELGVNTLVVTPGKSITDLMNDTLVKHFGKGKVAKLTTKTTKLKPINVVNIQALINMEPDLFKDIDLFIIDEFHHTAASTYLEANELHLKNCYYRVGLTATNFRTDGSDLALKSVLSDVLVRYLAPNAINEGMLLKPEFHIIDNKLQKEKTYQKAYKNQIVENAKRNCKIKELSEAHKKDSVLILVSQVKHGEILADMIDDCEFVHGQMKDSDKSKILNKFREGKITTLVGTSVIGEGVDLPIANILILGAGGKSKIQVMQNIGRVLRLYKNQDKAIVYDFLDKDGSWLQNHAQERQEIFKDYESILD